MEKAEALSAAQRARRRPRASVTTCLAVDGRQPRRRCGCLILSLTTDQFGESGGGEFAAREARGHVAKLVDEYERAYYRQKPGLVLRARDPRIPEPQRTS